MDQEFWNESYMEDAGQPAVRDFFIAEEIAGLEPGSALDMGCGTGDIALELAAMGWTVTGVDWAEHAIKLANEAAQERGLNAKFVVGDLMTWEAPQQYDLVLSSFAMPTGEGMKTAVATMTAALKAGGTLLICEWDQKMIPIWGFSEEDLHAVEAYVAAMPGLIIESAETRFVSNAFANDEIRGGSGQDAYVAFVRAKSAMDAKPS